MEKYHITPEGDVKNCKAIKGSCPFGGLENHFGSKKEALDHYEEINNSFQKFPTVNPIFDSILPTHINGIPFAKAWNEKFEKLTEEKSKYVPFEKKSAATLLANGPHGLERVRSEFILTAHEYNVETDMDLPKEYTHVLEVYTRLGGGNRECYCEEGEPHYCYTGAIENAESHPDHIYNKDDDFDSTYASYYFGLKLTPEELEDFNNANKKIDEIKDMDNIVQAINEGKRTPWGVFTKGEKYREYILLKERARNSERLRENYKERAEVINRVLNYSEDTIQPDDFRKLEKYNNMNRFVIGGIESRFKTRAKALNEIDKNKKLLEKINSLEDDELKNYIMKSSNNPEVSIKSSKRILDRVESELKVSLDALKKEKKDLNVYFKREERLDKALAKAREEAWSEGWPTDGGPIPKILKSF